MGRHTQVIQFSTHNERGAEGKAAVDQWHQQALGAASVGVPQGPQGPQGLGGAHKVSISTRPEDMAVPPGGGSETEPQAKQSAR